MEEFEHVEEANKSNKRPVFLTVLVVLTWLWAGISIMNAFTAMVSGPVSDEIMQEQELKAAESIAEMKELGQDDFIHLIELGTERMRFVNEQAFQKNYLIILVVGILGAIAGYMMWTLKKVGFHLYILYSLIYVGMSYLIYPLDMIINIEIYFNLFVAGLFVLLYSRNLHALK
jgi:hypothetical protein